MLIPEVQPIMLGAMVDLGSATPPRVVLERLTHTIVDQLRPRRIILIGSRARGDARPDSDYDVVVEFATDEKSAFDLARDVYALFPGRDWSLDVIVRASGEIERRANDPGMLDWDIAREGKVLYSSGGDVSLLPAAPSDSVRERPAEIPPSVREWSSQAERDLQQMRFSMDRGHSWNYVCYFAQQSAEKYLKASLVRSLVRPPHTHNLEMLLGALRSVGHPMAGLDADCSLLAPYAVTTRYGDPARFDEQVAQAAITAAENIAMAVAPLLN